jgi:hypothetical protein
VSCGCRFDEERSLAEATGPFGVDGNGALTELTTIGGVDVIVHHDDVPPSDVTTINGIRCTTAIRTVIDIATELDPADLALTIHDCLERCLFTLDEARQRLAQIDMSHHRGAERVRGILLEVE